MTLVMDATNGPSPTRQVSEWVTKVSPGDIPESAMSLALDGITDLIGVALAGHRAPVSEMVRSLAPLGKCTVWGTDQTTTADSAALANGTASHALDYDDYATGIHPSCVIVPALAAVSELRTLSGEELLTSYVVAFELQTRINLVLDGPEEMGHHLKGWHPTSTVGSLGATVAAAKALALDSDQVRMALGIAASFMSGLRGNFGTMVKPLHAGLAARNGVMAALLAERGLVADDDALEGWCGVGEVFGSMGSDWQGLDVASLGDRWAIEGPSGLTIKPYPSCGATHTAIEAAISLRDGLSSTSAEWPSDIERVTVGINRKVDRVLINHPPRTGLEGKFSLEYCVARALLRGEVGLEDFVDDVVTSSASTALMDRISLVRSPEMSALPYFPVEMVIEMKDGQHARAVVEEAPGSPRRRLSEDQLHKKFTGCVGSYWTNSSSDLWNALRRLPCLESGAELVGMLRGVPATDQSN